MTARVFLWLLQVCSGHEPFCLHASWHSVNVSFQKQRQYCSWDQQRFLSIEVCTGSDVAKDRSKADLWQLLHKKGRRHLRQRLRT